MAIFAQETNPSFWDNAVLDEFVIPFGDWFKQVVFWTDLNLGRLFQWIELPFAFLFNLILEAKFMGVPWPDWWPAKFLELRADDEEAYLDFGFGLQELPWWIVIAGFFLVALFVRNIKVATFVAFALTICGLLGTSFWDETTKTIGMVFVAVALCAIIGVPLGVACGRIDGLWSVVRPTLDAMQVVHPFVYMLPAIFFFGIGEVASTMVTMVFALPPIVRLTNLGVRQVPEDVVEASRAFGAPESRVLFDVQLPLSRVAIMTGLNQTLLLAFSMLGIAALMSAGGLGKLLLLALNNQQKELAASAGLAFFLVAVALDRMSQPESGDTSFWQRIGAAWTNRRTPENLLPDPDDAPAKATLSTGPDVVEALTARERMGFPIAAAGAVIALVSLFLTWSQGSVIPSHSRQADLDLDIASSGLDATGGSWYGYVVALCGVLALLSALNTWLRPGRGSRLFKPDVGLVTGGGVLGAAVAFLLVHPDINAVASKSIGGWIALVGGALIVLGYGLAAINAPYGPHSPLPGGIQWGRVIGCSVALAFLVLGSFSYWSSDTRGGTLMTPEIEAEIDRLREEAAGDPVKAAANAQEISNLVNSARASDLVQRNGFQEEGPGLGPLAIALGVLGLALALPGAGLFGRVEEHQQRFFNGLVGAVGFAIMALATGWIGSLARATDPGYVSGLGSFLVFCAGFIIFSSARGVLTQFFRRKVHKIDTSRGHTEETLFEAGIAEDELVGAAAGGAQ